MPTLSWYNRDADLTRAARAPYRLLQPVASISHGDPDSPNMLIEGDNLDALKALLPYYAGRVKCICIDPPYNTRSAFEHYQDNLEHSQWLAMMYPRLELLRSLLSNDGSIWVSIDDNEGHYLKVIMDEVFGRRNFIANVIWEKKYSRQNDALGLSISHDHILAYALDGRVFRPNKLERTQGQLKGYKNPDNDPRGPWQSVVYTCAKTRNERPNLYYPIKHPRTGKDVWPKETRVWGFDQEATARRISENRLWWGAEYQLDKPRLKSFLSEVKAGVVPNTVWLRSEVGDNQDAKREVLAFDSENVFTTPKPEALVRRILEVATSPADLVLDSFLGSGTTAAVAHKMGRHYIGIEMGPHARTHCQPRLSKVIEGEQGGISKDVEWKGGGGFRFYKLGPPIFDENGHIQAGIRFEHLAAHIWFAETGVARSSRASNAGKSAFLGEHHGVGYYLLYNGVLGDDSAKGGNVLTRRLLRSLPKFDGPKVIYGEACELSADQRRELNITFRQTPYDIKAR